MRFESGQVIRLLSKDSRDLLYLYDEHTNKLNYLGEAKRTNSFQQISDLKRGQHMLDSLKERGSLASLVEKNSQYVCSE